VHRPKKGILAAMVFVAANVVGVVACLKSNPVTDSFVSSDGKYRIDLRGEKDRPLTPFSFNNRMVAEMFVDGKLFGRDEVHVADWMDTSFDLTYQRFRWHGEGVFGMHGIQDHEQTTVENGDSLTITNSSSKKISYLNLSFGVNRFLVFALEPRSSHTVYVHHSMAPEWIAGSGQFDDGLKLAWKGLNFFEDAKKNRERLFRYCLTVTNTELVINSIDVEGENLHPSRITPRVGACGN